MASTIASIITLVRATLNEPVEITDGFWTDAQLAAWIDKGARDLWRAINDLQNQDYFLTVDATNVATAANTEALTGVPADVGIVRGLEPRSLATYPSLNFEGSASYNSITFQRARRASVISPGSSGGNVQYALTGAGAPVGAPTIRIAPLVDAIVPLRLSYAPTLAAITKTDTNPIPGESDNALAAWCTAYALGKESEQRIPDAGWLAIYATEKTNFLVSLTPRADEDDTVAEAFFEDEWQ